jgi:hypothetical protein
MIGERVQFKDHGETLAGIVPGRVGLDILQIRVGQDRNFEIHESGVRFVYSSGGPNPLAHRIGR